jgi:phosphohistidine phosphatase SixA
MSLETGIRMNRFKALFIAVLLAAVSMSPMVANATEAGWALLRNGGQVVLLVHANAPGTGDPANFDIENCRTQRNLSDRGRQQAQRLGALIAARAEPVEKVYSSRYCRTLDTARLAFGPRLVEELPALDSIDRKADSADASKDEILALIRDYTGSGNLVLVTHRENVAALTGVTPREAEAVIVALDGDKLTAIGRIVFN